MTKRCKITPKKISTHFFAQNSPKPILSFKKCNENPLLTGNGSFSHCESRHCVAAMDVLIKKTVIVQILQLLNFPTWSFQDVAGVKRDILVILEQPQKQLWGCGDRGRMRWQQRVYGTHNFSSILHLICSTYLNVYLSRSINTDFVSL